MVAEQIDEERARKTSLEQRGVFVLSSAGAVSALLFGLAAFVTGSDGFTLSSSAIGPLIVAVAAFAVASVLGLLTNMPLNYQEPGIESLDALIRDEASLDESYEIAMFEVAKARLKTLAAHREKNGLKAWLLMGALGFEVVGTCFVSLSVLRILLDA